MSVKLDGAYFKQTKLIRPNNNSAINIYIVYKIEPIFRVSDCNWTRTHNHLVHKRTLNHLAKLAK